MKRWLFILTAALAVFLTTDLRAQERRTLRAARDVVSAHIWRGVWESGSAFTAHADDDRRKLLGDGLGFGRLSPQPSYKEMDSHWPTRSVRNLRWPTFTGKAEPRPRHGFRAAANYFPLRNDSPTASRRASHGVSTRKSRHAGLNTVPFGPADVNATGERVTPTYAEVSYPFAVKDVEMKAGWASCRGTPL